MHIQIRSNLNRNYKNLEWLWGAGWRFHHEGNCSASWGLPSDATVTRVTEFSIRNEHYRFFFLQTLPSTIVFKLEYALFYQFYAEITAFSIKKCSVRHPSTTSWCHAQCRLTPSHVRRKYPERMKIAENLVGYVRIYLPFLLHLIPSLSGMHFCLLKSHSSTEPHHAKTCLWGFSTRSDLNQPAQLARILKLWI